MPSESGERPRSTGTIDDRRQTAGESTTQRTKLTPPELARRWGVSPSKIIAWIKSGELPAINAATNRSGRPRYLIDIADLVIFENRRSAAQTPAPRRRRTKNEDVIEFF